MVLYFCHWILLWDIMYAKKLRFSWRPLQVFICCQVSVWLQKCFFFFPAQQIVKWWFHINGQMQRYWFHFENSEMLIWSKKLISYQKQQNADFMSTRKLKDVDFTSKTRNVHFTSTHKLKEVDFTSKTVKMLIPQKLVSSKMSISLQKLSNVDSTRMSKFKDVGFSSKTIKSWFHENVWEQRCSFHIRNSEMLISQGSCGKG